MLGARSLLVGLACVALIAVASAVAAPPRAASPPNELLQAFPLNPTGERIVSPQSAHVGAFRPPAREEAVARTVEAGSDSLPLAAILGSILAVVCVAALSLILVGRASRRRETAEAPAYISAVYVGTRYLPVIDGTADRKRGPVRRADLVPALVGGAIALVVALLVIQQVG